MCHIFSNGVPTCVTLALCKMIFIIISFNVESYNEPAWMSQSFSCEVSALLNFTFFFVYNLRLLPPAMKLGQGYIFTGVCDSFHMGGGWSGGFCLSACRDTNPPGPGICLDQAPPDQVPPAPDQAPSPDQAPPPPPGQAPHEPGTPQTRPPPAQSMLGDMVNARAVRILLECSLVLYTTGSF